MHNKIFSDLKTSTQWSQSMQLRPGWTKSWCKPVREGMVLISLGLTCHWWTFSCHKLKLKFKLVSTHLVLFSCSAVGQLSVLLLQLRKTLRPVFQGSKSSQLLYDIITWAATATVIAFNSCAFELKAWELIYPLQRWVFCLSLLYLCTEGISNFARFLKRLHTHTLLLWRERVGTQISNVFIHCCCCCCDQPVLCSYIWNKKLTIFSKNVQFSGSW